MSDPLCCPVCGAVATYNERDRLVIEHDAELHGVAEKREDDLPARARRAQPVRLAPFTPHLER